MAPSRGPFVISWSLLGPARGSFPRIPWKLFQSAEWVSEHSFWPRELSSLHLPWNPPLALAWELPSPCSPWNPLLALA